ncbi:MAG TPA: MBL fold metallo-hydrolase [Pararhizobium sp.]|nr:MBL fold metallo-hydrolase [Pararhizobium sp.]
MQPLSRRDVFRLAGLGAAVAAAPTALANPASAASIPMQDKAPPETFKRFKLASFEITILSDGHRIVPDPQAVFGTDQKKAAVEDLLVANFLPKQAMQFSFAPVLINTGSELVLVDTGNGEAGRKGGAGQMLQSLKASGYKPGDVSIVVITHMHPDHIGGIMEADKPAFPNARYVTGKREYAFWSDRARMGTKAERNHQLVEKLIVPLAGKFTFINEGDQVAPGITGINAFGHTPGHMIFRIESGQKTLILTADTANHFVLSLQRPDWQVVFDWNKEQATQTRKKVFDMISAERIPFIGYHMPFPSVGYVEKRPPGYYYVPESYQFAI